jgi:uncharacterized membrane protein (GlpM family)
MDLKYLFYFFVGGMVVSIVSYLASHGKGLIAAFFANLPVITFVTFIIIYMKSGEKYVTDYAKSLLIMLFPWLSYIFSVIILGEKIGIIPSLIVGLTAYFLISFFIIKFLLIKI